MNCTHESSWYIHIRNRKYLKSSYERKDNSSSMTCPNLPRAVYKIFTGAPEFDKKRKTTKKEKIEVDQEKKRTLIDSQNKCFVFSPSYISVAQRWHISLITWVMMIKIVIISDIKVRMISKIYFSCVYYVDLRREIS